MVHNSLTLSTNTSNRTVIRWLAVAWAVVIWFNVNQSIWAQPSQQSESGRLLWEQVARPPEGFSRPPFLREYFQLDEGHKRDILLPVTEIDLFPSPGIVRALGGAARGDGWSVEEHLVVGIRQRSTSGSFGLRLRGFLVPLLSGDYRFSLASDDGARIYLNSDGESVEGSRSIATLNHSNFLAFELSTIQEPNRTSEPVTLTAGMRYYFEVVMHERTGSSHLGVQWHRPDGVVELLPLAVLEPLPPEFALDIVDPAVPAFIPALVDADVLTRVQGGVSLIESVALWVDGELVDQRDRSNLQSFFEENGSSFDRFLVDETIPLRWPEPVEGEHDVVVEVVDVLGFSTPSDILRVRVTQDCSGLVGSYYSSTDLDEGSLLDGKIDAVVDFQWATGAPQTIFTTPDFVPSASYSVRWSGYLFVRDDGDYSFKVRSGGGVRLWIDGGDSAVIDDWDFDPENDPDSEHSTTVTLEGGRYVPVRLDYREAASSEAFVTLLWTPPGGQEEVVPARAWYYCEDRRPRNQLTEPFANERLPVDAPMQLAVEAEGIFEALERVEFVVDGELVATVPAGADRSFAAFWSGGAAGRHEVFARAVDETGAIMTTETIEVDLSSDVPDCLDAVYRTSFENGVGAEWTPRRLATAPNSGQQFLGPFGDEVLQLTLTDLGPHTALAIEFDLYVLRSWEGSGAAVGGQAESWSVELGDGSGKFEFSFSNLPGAEGFVQSFPNPLGDGENPPRTGAVMPLNSLGYYYGNGNLPTVPMDSVYRVRLPIMDHETSELVVVFRGPGLRQIQDESWGVDHLVVKTVESSAPPEIIGQPLDQNVLVGGETRFDVVSGTRGLLRYQWFKDQNRLLGAQSSSLILTDVMVADAGQYHVNISNCSGVIASQKATLSVIVPNEAPSLRGLPEQIQLKEDGGEVSVLFIVSDPNDAIGDLVLNITSETEGVLGEGSLDYESVSVEGQRLLTITPGPDTFGVDTLTFDVRDPAGARFQQSLPVVIEAINDVPTLDPIDLISILVGEPVPLIALTGIGTGAANEEQDLVVGVRLIDSPIWGAAELDYTTPASTGELRLTLQSEAVGTAAFVVSVDDGAGSNNFKEVPGLVKVDPRPNQLPTITLLAAVPGAGLIADDPLPVSFTVDDSDGEVVAVRFLVDDLEVATLTETPFQFDWQPEAAGEFRLQGEARDDQEGVTVSESLVVTVLPANRAPVLTPPDAIEWREDSEGVRVALEVQDDYSELPDLTWGVSVENSDLVTTAEVVVEDGVALLVLESGADQFGGTLLRLTATDPRGKAAELPITVTVQRVNDPPSLNPISAVTFFAGGEPPEVALSGIGSGAVNEEQSLRVEAVSSQPSLLPDPTITYESPASMGLLSLLPIAGQFGEAEVTVTVFDGEVDDGMISQRFLVTIEQLPNQLPVVRISNPVDGESVTQGDVVSVALVATDEDGAVTTVALLVDGVEVGRVSEMPYVIEWGPDRVGDHVLQGQVVDDRQGMSLSESIAINVLKRNEAPELTAFEDLTLVEDDLPQGVGVVVSDDLTALESLNLTASIKSGLELLDGAPEVVFDGTQWVLQFGLAPDAFGEAILEVRAEDGDGLEASASLALTIASVNDEPTLAPIAGVEVKENSDEISVPLSGIGSGAANEQDRLVVRATSGNVALLPDPTVIYQSPAAVGELRLKVTPNMFGASRVSVTVDDGTASGNLVTVDFQVMVTEVPNQAPVVALIEPLNGAEFAPEDDIAFAVTATDPDGGIDRVEFLVDGEIVGVVDEAPYRFVIPSSPAGRHEFVARAHDREGASTDSITLVYSVQVALPSLGIALTAPGNHDVYCPTSVVEFSADVLGPVEGVRRVEFYAGEFLLGSDDDAPYEFRWEEPLVGDFTVSARLITVNAESLPSEGVSIGVSEECGDVVILQASAHEEVETLREYLFEMGLGSTVVGPTQATIRLLQTFPVVILHLGDEGGVTEAMIVMLDELRRPSEATGRAPSSLYIIGNQLLEEGEALDRPVREQWFGLLGLEPGGGEVEGSTVEIFSSPDGFELVEGRFGELRPFDYGLTLEDGIALGEADVVAFSGPSDLAVAQPQFGNFETTVRRSLTQNFYVVDGGEGLSVAERKRFFQNSVCWLARCSRCSNVDLPLQIIEEPPASAEVGVPFTVGIRLVNNGACEATAAQITGNLSPGLQLVGVTAEQGLGWDFRSESGLLTVNLGRVGRGDPAAVEVELTLMPVGPGAQIWELCSRSNNTFDSCRTFELGVEGVRPPQLVSERSSVSELSLSLVADPGAVYSVQESGDLVEWIDFETGVSNTWRGRVPLNADNGESRFFRVVVGR